MYITAQGPRLRNDLYKLYCVEWDVKPYYTILDYCPKFYAYAFQSSPDA